MGTVEHPSARKRSLTRAALVFWPIVIPVAFGLYLFFESRSELMGQLQRLAQAESDNTTWNITQLEVDYLNLLVAVDAVVQLETGDPSAVATVDEARLRYDILLSRMGMLDTIDPETQFANNPKAIDEFQEAFRAVVALESVFSLDGSAFVARASSTQDALAARRPDIRSVVLTTLEAHVSRAVEQRLQLRSLLVSLTGIGLTALVILTSISSALVVANASAKKRAEAQQRVTSNLTTTIESSPFGMMTADRNGVVRQFNSAAEKMFRIDKSEVLGRPVSELGFFSSSQHHQLLSPESVSDHAARRSVVHHRLICRRSDGESFASEVVFAFDEDAMRLPVAIVCVRDTSEQEAREAALAKAVTRARDSEKAKTRFLAVMSHEMRSPLSSAIAAIELLEATDGFDDQQKLYLDIVRNGAAAALEQVDDVLELARLDGGSMNEEPVALDLRAYMSGIERNYRPLAEKRNNRLVLEATGLDNTCVLVRRRLLSRVITNLIGNAIKFTEDGTVSVGFALMSNDSEQYDLKIQIADTGPGIEPDMLEAVFEDFKVLDSNDAMSGSGLGLGIVRRAVEAMGGTVDVSSKPSVGTVFHLSVPVARTSPSEEPAIVVSSDNPGPKANPHRHGLGEDPRSVLIVDDAEPNRIVLREMVLRLGHFPLLAENGAEAIEMSIDETPDLVLMDCSMPGMSGANAALEIQRIMKDDAPRIVGLTANVMQVQPHASPERVFECLEWKPMRLARLKDLIENPPTVSEQRAGSSPEPALADMYEVRQLIGPEQFGVLIVSLSAELESLLMELDSPTPPNPDFVHRAAGACASLGVKPIHDLLQEIETAMRTDQKGGDLSVLAGSLHAEWKRIRLIIQEGGTEAALMT